MTPTTIAQIIFCSPLSLGSRRADVTLLLSTERYSLCPCSETDKKRVASYLCHQLIKWPEAPGRVDVSRSAVEETRWTGGVKAG